MEPEPRRSGRLPWTVTLAMACIAAGGIGYLVGRSASTGPSSPSTEPASADGGPSVPPLVSTGAEAHSRQSPQSARIVIAGNEVQLKPGDSPELARRMTASSRDDFTPAPALVHFHRKPTPEDHARLREAGVRLMGHVGDGAYHLVLERFESLERVRDLVRAADVVRAEWKLHPDVRSAVEAPSSAPAWSVTTDGRLRVVVQVLPRTPRAAARLELERVARRVQAFGIDFYALEVAPAEVSALAGLELVRFVHLGPGPTRDHNDHVRDAVGTNVVHQIKEYEPSPWYFGLTGEDVRVAIDDGGIWSNHKDFKEPALGSPDVARVFSAGFEGFNNHGTQVASIVGGSGRASVEDPAGYPAWSLRGQAPRVLLGSFEKFFDVAGSPTEVLDGILDAYEEALLDEDAYVTNHSYGFEGSDEYGWGAILIDHVVRGGAFENSEGTFIDFPGRPDVWSAGNMNLEKGYYSLENVAKNAIVVGALQNGFGTPSGTLWHQSSLGPTLDGRIKPDLVAPGALVVAARVPETLNLEDKESYSPDSSVYLGFSGTSMAAPVVTGAIALLVEELGESTGVFPYDTPPSLFKALLVNTAVDIVKTATLVEGEENADITDEKSMTPVFDGPDFATGFGMVDVDAAVLAARDESLRKVGKILDTSQIDEFCAVVPEGLERLRVTLAWDDEAGGTFSGDGHLVNDLDVTLTHVDDDTGLETRWEPWTLEPLPKTPLLAEVVPAQRGEDHRNNVEQIEVPEPLPGVWKLRVSASELENGGPQTYSLVTSVPFPSFCFEAEILLDPLHWLKSWRLPPWLDWGDIFLGAYDGSLWLRPAGVFPLNQMQHLIPGPPPLMNTTDDVTLRLRGLPEDAVVVLFERSGEIVVRDDGPGEERRIQLGEAGPARPLYFVVGRETGRGLQPYSAEELEGDPDVPDTAGKLLLRLDWLGVEPVQRPRPSREVLRPLYLHGRRVATGTGVSARLRKALDDARGKSEPPVHAVVQLHGHPTGTEVRRLETGGVRLGTFLGATNYLARLEPDATLDDELLRWLDLVDPFAKVREPELDEDGADVLVEFHEGVATDAQLEILEKLEGAFLPLERDLWSGKLQASELRELAAENAVWRIESR